MQTAIQVKFDNAPKPGKKMANVKDAAGTTYFYYPDKMGFRVGETVNIEYETQTWGDKPVNVIKRIVPVQEAAQAPTGYQPGPRQAVMTPPPASHNGNHDKDRLIFVTGVVGRAMGSGQYGAQDIGMLTKAAMVAFHESFGTDS